MVHFMFPLPGLYHRSRDGQCDGNEQFDEGNGQFDEGNGQFDQIEWLDQKEQLGMNVW